jgi:hypothetical protein
VCAGAGDGVAGWPSSALASGGVERRAAGRGRASGWMRAGGSAPCRRGRVCGGEWGSGSGAVDGGGSVAVDKAVMGDVVDGLAADGGGERGSAMRSRPWEGEMRPSDARMMRCAPESASECNRGCRHGP